MIDKKYYDIIKYFCKNRETSSVDEKILLHKFYTEYFDTLEEQEASKMKISVSEIAGYVKILLSETNLNKNLKIAESEIEDLISDKIKKIEIKYKFKNVVLTIVVNIVSSFLYTFLLIMLLAAARNQIKSIFLDIFVAPTITIDKPLE